MMATGAALPHPCIQCRLNVRDRQEALQCPGCMLWQHRPCGTGISRDAYRQARREQAEIDWCCHWCTMVVDLVQERPDHESTRIEINGIL
jgi:hypothetical protein